MHFRISAQRVTDNDEEEIADGHDQAHGKANRSLAAVGSNAKRHTDDGERDAGERK